MINYYECIKSYDSYGIGKIHNESEKPPWFKNFKSIQDFKNNGKYFEYWFKPSTLEAYEAQLKSKESLVGRWIKALIHKINGCGAELGKYYKIIGDERDMYKLNISPSYIAKGNISDFELMPIGWEPNKKENLLKLAKQNYPIGTKFITIYGGTKELIVTDTNYLSSKNSDNYDIISVSTNKGSGTLIKNSAAIWSEEKGWAKIIKSNIPTLEEAEKMFPIGTECTNTNLYPECKSYIVVQSKPYFTPLNEEILIKVKSGCTYTIWKDGIWAIKQESKPLNLSNTNLKDNLLYDLDIPAAKYEHTVDASHWSIGIDPYRKIETFPLTAKECFVKKTKFDEQQFLNKEYNKEFKLNIKQKSKTQLKLKL